MVKYYEEYGCDKCNTYPLLPIVLNISPTDNVTAWHTGHTLGGKLLVNLNGGNGKEFFKMFQTAETALQEFIIKPDYTWESTKDIASDSTKPAIGSEFFTSKGIYPHDTCGKVHVHVCKAEQQKAFSVSMEHNSLEIIVKDEGSYTVKLFSPRGQVVTTLQNCQLKKGSNSLETGVANFSKGIYFVEILSGVNASWHKVVVK